MVIGTIHAGIALVCPAQEPIMAEWQLIVEFRKCFIGTIPLRRVGGVDAENAPLQAVGQIVRELVGGHLARFKAPVKLEAFAHEGFLLVIEHPKITRSLETRIDVV
jgi:hypothetical protein